MHFVSFGEEELGQVAAVLARDPGDQPPSCRHVATSRPLTPSLRATRPRARHSTPWLRRGSKNGGKRKRGRSLGGAAYWAAGLSGPAGTPSKPRPAPAMPPVPLQRHRRGRRPLVRLFPIARTGPMGRNSCNLFWIKQFALFLQQPTDPAIRWNRNGRLSLPQRTVGMEPPVHNSPGEGVARERRSCLMDADSVPAGQAPSARARPPSPLTRAATRRDAELLHLPVEVGPLDAQLARGVPQVAPVGGKPLQDVLPLELRSRGAQR